ncbi:MAG: histidine phosphatase family protein [Pirellulales bacterium]
MKTLILMRHAKSDHADATLTDHQRPLNARGVLSAPKMARRIRDCRLAPDAIVSSTAVRARDTARLVAEALEYTAAIDERRALYLTSPHAYVSEIRSLPDSWQCVLVVGHNPTLESLVNLWSDEECDFPTAATAVFEWHVASWGRVSLDARPKLLELWRPRDDG